MGNLGFSELVVIFVLALIVFGPRKLPELGRTLAKALAEFRKASAELKMAVDEEMRELERHTRELEAKANELLEPSAAAPPALAEGSADSNSIASPQPVAPALGSEELHSGEKPADGDPKPA
jgi:Tat protein translocase TatB subunit